MAIVKDIRQKEFNSANKYSRIVSLSPSVSELLYDLNMETRIVGLTSLCDEPKYLRETHNVIGGPSEVNMDLLRELSPDLILMSEDDNMALEISELEAVCNVFLFNVVDMATNKELIQNLGILFNKRDESMKLNLKIDIQLEDLKKVTEGLKYRRAVYFLMNDPWVAVGKNNYINSMLGLLNVINPFAELKERYPVVSAANIKLAHTDIVMLPVDEPHAFSEAESIEIAANTHDASLFFIDGKMLSRYGSRTVKALDYLKLLAVKFKEMN